MKTTDWEDLRHFAAFAEARTLSGAAVSLGVDHVTVGRRIAALEAHLGVKLIDRRSRIPALTTEGERIAERTRLMTASADDVLRAARGMTPGLSGEVSISAPPTVATALIAPSLVRLHRSQPQLRIHLLGEKQIVSLSRREADLAVRLSRPRESGLVGRKLGAFRFELWATAGYLKGRAPKDFGFIAFDDDDFGLPQQKWLREVAGDRPIVLRTNDLESQYAACLAGLGVATLPSYLSARSTSLVAVKTRRSPVVREVWLVVHDDLRHAPAVRVVIDHLVEVFAPLSR